MARRLVRRASTPRLVRWVAGLLAAAGAVGLAPAAAERPLPDYREHVQVDLWLEVNARIEEARLLLADIDPERDPTRAGPTEREARAKLRSAVDRALELEREVVASSGLAYLRGLAWRLLDRPAEAEAAWLTSVERDEQAWDAWYDLGELRLSQGRFADAQPCFQRVTDGLVHGPDAWRAPLRLAETAAHQGDAPLFESALREALRRGWDLRQLPALPHWRPFLDDPALRDALTKLITVYGDPDLIRQLEAADPP